MSRKLALSLGCIVTSLLLPALAQADSISFSFFASPGVGTFAATSSGIATSSTGIMAVSGGSAVTPIFAPGTLTTLTTGAASPMSGYSGANLNSAGGVNFGNGAPNVIDVEVYSMTLCGGVCVSGTQNQGILQAPSGSQGAFLGTFAVNTSSVSPTILALLGFGPDDVVQVSGSDSLDITDDKFDAGAQKEDADFAGGVVTISIVPAVPEPASLLLFGTGLLAVAGLVHRKKRTNP